MKKIEIHNQKFLGFVLATVAYTIWGFSNIFTRIALQTATPDILLAVRFVIAFLTINLFLLTGKVKISFRGKKIGGLLLLGVLNPVLYFYFESYGIFYTNATLAGAMMALNPIISLMLAVVLLNEEPTTKQKVFVWLPIVGVVMITLSTYVEGAMRPIGIVLLVATSFCSNFARIVNRVISTEFTAFERTYIMILMGVIVFTSVAVIKNLRDMDVIIESLKTPSFLIPAFLLGAFCSFAAFLCVNYATTHLSVTQISVFPSLSTVISIAAGALVLGEPLTGVAVIGAVLIVIGVWKVIL